MLEVVRYAGIESALFQVFQRKGWVMPMQLVQSHLGFQSRVMRMPRAYSHWTRSECGVWLAAWLLACWLMGGWATVAVGQNYETLKIADKYLVPVLSELATRDERTKLAAKISEVKSRITEDESTVTDLLKSNSATHETFDSFFRDYIFAEMAQTEDIYLSNLATKRKDFLRKFLANEFSGSNRIYLIERLLLPTMQKVAEGNFHPAARLNAVLLIGLANNLDGNSFSGEAPTPNGACVKYLISVMNQESLPVYLKVGAYTGLHRVAQIEGVQPRIDANDAKQLFAMALSICEGKFAGQDQWPKDVNYWLRRRAVQTLGFLHNPGPAGETVAALLALVDDKQQEFLLRLDAVESLGLLNYPNAATARVSAVTQSIASFMAEALLNQADQIRADVDDFIAINLLDGGNFIFRKGVEGRGSSGKGEGLTAGTGGLDGGDAPAGGGGSGSAADGPVFEMPNYYLNLQRRTCKNYIFVGQNVFAKTGKLYQLGIDAERLLMDESLKVFNNVMEKSDQGLVDLSKTESKKDDDKRERVGTGVVAGPKRPIVWEFMSLFTQAGEKLKSLVAAQKKEAGPEAEPPATTGQ